MNLMPFAVTELEGGGWLEDSGDGATAIVDREGDGSVNHLQDQVVASTLKTNFSVKYSINYIFDICLHLGRGLIILS